MSAEDPSSGDVSRETSPLLYVDVVAEMFGAQRDAAQRYVALLAGAGVERGLIGPREIPRLWARHLLNCANLRELITAGAFVIDVGSGAGLPGIPLALARPDLAVTLLEPLERRFRFLREVVDDLGLGDRVAVVRGRAEDVAGELTAPFVTARAVAPLATLYRWTLPLVRRNGHLLAIKGRSAADDIAAAAESLAALGVRSHPEIIHCGPSDETGTTVVRVGRGDAPLRRPKALDRTMT